MEGKNCQRLFTMMFYLFPVLLFSGRQPTEYVNEAGSFSSCGVVRATWYGSEGRRFLRHKSFLHIVSLQAQLYINGLCP